MRARNVSAFGAHGGTACPALNETKPCNNQTCPWECSAAKVCNVCPACCQPYIPPGALCDKCATETCPQPCAMAPWGAWGACNATCGGGAQQRARAVATAPRNGGTPCAALNDTRPCNSGGCPVDCAATAWGNWSDCSLPCAGGSRVRARAVASPAALGGKACPALNETAPCAVNRTFGAWSACSLTCDGGTQRRLGAPAAARYLNGTARAACPARNETRACATQPCALNCTFSAWGAWGACSATCGTGAERRLRSVLTAVSFDGASKAVSAAERAAGKPGCPPINDTRTCATTPCCTVGQWGAWGACSKTCGAAATKARSRAVTSAHWVAAQASTAAALAAANATFGNTSAAAAPHNATAAAAAAAAVAASLAACPPLANSSGCGLPNCPANCSVSGWGAFSNCTASCGGGTRSRSRSVLVPQGGSGAACPALAEAQNCSMAPCVIDCQTSNWTAWSACSRMCGGGTQNRTRVVTVPAANNGTACPALNASQACSTGACACGTSAGGTTPFDAAKCTVCAKCCKDYVLPHLCDRCVTDDCATPRACTVSAWAPWSDCPRNCSGHSKVRTRAVVALAVNGGKACPAVNETAPCGAAPCGNECSPSVPPGGCSAHVCATCCNPFIPYGANCDTCVTANCRRNCTASPWSEWGLCTTSCNGTNAATAGVQSRNRTVLLAPRLNGTLCPALNETRACVPTPCVYNCSTAAWGDWGNCSKACGGGTQNRTRAVVVRPTATGTACPALRQGRGCNNHTDCPVPCNISAWSAWGACTKSCGAGTQARNRTVVAPPLHGGAACGALNGTRACATAPCPNECNATKICNVCDNCCKEYIPDGATCDLCVKENCPVDCKVAAFGNWSACSTSCGAGTRLRARNVTVPTRYKGKPCPALNESSACPAPRPPCPVPCQLSAWSAWGNCSRACDTGVQRRNRTVVAAPQFNGTCAALNDTRPCKLRACALQCFPSQWGSWSSCGCASSAAAAAAAAAGAGVAGAAAAAAALGTYNRTRSSSNVTEALAALLATFDPTPLNGTNATNAINTANGTDGTSIVAGTTAVPAAAQPLAVLSVIMANGTNATNATNATIAAQLPATRAGVLQRYCGALTEQKNCSDRCPANCTVSQWGGWEPCSTICGVGSQTRGRAVTRAAANGGTLCAALNDTRLCNTQRCPNFNISIEVVSRSIALVYPSSAASAAWTPNASVGVEVSWNTDEPGVNLTIANFTFGEGCANISSVGRRSAVDVTPPPPSPNATKPRCNPKAAGGGCNMCKECCFDYIPNGPLCDLCVSEQCPPPRDCSVAPWGNWSACTVTCGAGGKQRRARNVTTPAAHNGTACPALNETRACNSFSCNKAGGALNASSSSSSSSSSSLAVDPFYAAYAAAHTLTTAHAAVYLGGGRSSAVCVATTRVRIESFLSGVTFRNVSVRFQVARLVATEPNVTAVAESPASNPALEWPIGSAVPLALRAEGINNPLAAATGGSAGGGLGTDVLVDVYRASDGARMLAGSHAIARGGAGWARTLAAPPAGSGLSQAYRWAGNLTVPGLPVGVYRVVVSAIDRAGAPFNTRASPSVTIAPVRFVQPFAFVGGNWSACSKTCGEGVQSRAVACRAAAVGGGAAQASEAPCRALHLLPPAPSRPCLLVLCNVSSLTLNQAMRYACVAPGAAPPAAGAKVEASALLCGEGSWGGCNATCGGGFRNRSLACVNGATLTASPAASCAAAVAAGAALVAPRSLARCNDHPCAQLTYLRSNWSECESSCARAHKGASSAATSSAHSIRSRTVTCVSLPSHAALPLARCAAAAVPVPASDSGVAVTSSCAFQKCPDFHWAYTQFSTCSASCGGGEQRREEQCRRADNSGTKWDGSAITAKDCQDSLAAMATRKVVTGAPCDAARQHTCRQCNTHACVTYAYDLGRWSACTASCGGGTQARAVTCVRYQFDAARRAEVATSAPLSACAPTLGAPPASAAGCATAACDVCAGVACSGHGTCAARLQVGAAGAAGGSVAECSCDANYTSQGGLNCVGGAAGPVVPACAAPRRLSPALKCFHGVMTLPRHANGSVVAGAQGVACETAAAAAAAGRTARVDGAGRCCAAGVLDACKACGGNGTATDVTGRCCASLPLDGGGRCCDAMAGAGGGGGGGAAMAPVDACGVCNGDGSSCRKVVTVRLALPAKQAYLPVSSLLQPTSSQRIIFEAEFVAAYAARLGFPTSAMRITGLKAVYKTAAGALVVASGRRLQQEQQRRRRQRRQLAAALGTMHSLEPSFEVVGSALNTTANSSSSSGGGGGGGGSSSSGGGGGGGGGTIVTVQHLLSDLLLWENEAEASGAAAATQFPFAPVAEPSVIMGGVCGNGLCEFGERCEAHGSNGASCCRDDCPLLFHPCPTTPGAALPCGGNGACIASSGGCRCDVLAGYAGEACGDCAAGFRFVGVEQATGRRICEPLMLRIVAPTTAPPAPPAPVQNTTTPGPGLPGAASGGTSAAMIAIIVVALLAVGLFAAHRAGMLDETLERWGFGGGDGAEGKGGKAGGKASKAESAIQQAEISFLDSPGDTKKGGQHGALALQGDAAMEADDTAYAATPAPLNGGHGGGGDAGGAMGGDNVVEVYYEQGPLLLGLAPADAARGLGAVVRQFGRNVDGSAGAAEACGQVAPGDELLSANGEAVGHLPFDEVSSLLQRSSFPMSLQFLAAMAMPASFGAQPPATPGQQQQQQQHAGMRAASPNFRLDIAGTPSTPASAARAHGGDARAPPTPLPYEQQPQQQQQQQQQAGAGAGAYEHLIGEEEEALLRMFFEEVDADGSGAIQREELGCILHVLGLQDADDAMAQMDTDGNGAVAFEEFLRFMALQVRGSYAWGRRSRRRAPLCRARRDRADGRDHAGIFAATAQSFAYSPHPSPSPYPRCLLVGTAGGARLRPQQPCRALLKVKTV